MNEYRKDQARSLVLLATSEERPHGLNHPLLKLSLIGTRAIKTRGQDSSP